MGCARAGFRLCARVWGRVCACTTLREVLHYVTLRYVAYVLQAGLGFAPNWSQHVAHGVLHMHCKCHWKATIVAFLEY